MLNRVRYIINSFYGNKVTYAFAGLLKKATEQVSRLIKKKVSLKLHSLLKQIMEKFILFKTVLGLNSSDYLLVNI